MSLLRLAWRNVGRNRRRTALTAGVVGFGFAALTLAAGFMAQSFDALREGTIRGGTGHLQLSTSAYFERGAAEPLENGLPDAARVAARARAYPEVTVVLPRLDFYGLLTAGERSVPFVGVGLEPRAEAGYMDAPQLVERGEWLASGGGATVVLGAGLARSLGADLGDVVTLFAVTVDGVLNALDAEVVGIATLPVREMDERYLAAPLPVADRLLAAHGAVSKLVLVLGDGERAAAVGEGLRRELRAEGLEVSFRTWEELALFYRQVRYLYLGIFGFLGTVLLLVVLLSAANSMLMATTERTREIGTLRSLGMRPGVVGRLFVLEGLAIGALGCAGGALFSLVLRTALNGAHLMLPPPPGVAHPVPLFIQLYPEAYLLAAVAMGIAALLATWLPARRAARLAIVDALAHV